MSDLSNHAQLPATYARDGFVVVRNFLKSGELGELRASLDRYIKEDVPTLPDSSAFFHDRDRPETLKQLQQIHDENLVRYAHHKHWISLAETLIGEPVQAQQTPEWFNKPPGIDHTTPPHQDNYYFCLTPASVTTIWVALDSSTAANGALRYVQGSHLLGIRPHGSTNVLGFSQGITDYGPADAAREQLIELNPGDAVAHHGNTIHRADPNRSETSDRRAFAIVFQAQSCQRDEDAFQRYMQNVNQQHQSLGLQTTSDKNAL